MAMFDRMRERLRGQQPVGAAQQMMPPQEPGMQPGAEGQMPMGTQVPDIGFRGGRRPGERVPMDPEMSEGDKELMMRPESTQTAEARAMGAKMGAQSLLDMIGASSFRRQELGDEGRIMNRQKINELTQILLKYQSAKASVNQRIIKAQQWWKLKNWQEIKENRGVKASTTHPSNTGWLWNCIVGKHADAIDSYPEPVILPRMEDDKEEATRLSRIVPVVMEINDFEETYNDCSWQKMQEGTGCYGVFWNQRKLNGLGDIDIKKTNMLNLYWEPGVTDIQDSRYVFFISYEDKGDLVKEHPELEGKLNTTKLTPVEYKTDDKIDLSDKAAVIDCYYKQTDEEGRTVLHYCKFVNESCLYSSEEEGLEEGYYADGQYPFVLDPLYPVEGSPAGYGYIDIAKDTQTDIDTISQAMVQNAAMRATPRYFQRRDGGINEKEFADWSNPIVHVNGNLGGDSYMPIEVPQMGGDAHNMLAQKIDELKFITGNTDVNNGGVPSGVTAASAIAALKEDSGRSSKDSTKAAYRSYRKIVLMVIERIRQFYDIPRQFRILGQDGQEEFVSYSNENLQAQQIQNLPGQEPGMRLPLFDIEVRAQRENAYTKMSQNELALQFFSNGMLNPQATDQALIALEMMDFRGKDELKKRIEQQGTLLQTLTQVGQIALQLASQYRPDIADQLAMQLQSVAAEAGANIGGGGGGGASMQAPADNMSAPNPNENALVKRSRERAANATRPS